MSTTSLPDTSLAAYRALTPEKLAKDYKDIIIALRFLDEATYEEISQTLTWHDMGKASRRLKEMEAMQLIYKPGKKRLTRRKRSAYVYKLVEK